jgi:hypothetical protein
VRDGGIPSLISLGQKSGVHHEESLGEGDVSLDGGARQRGG